MAQRWSSLALFPAFGALFGTPSTRSLLLLGVSVLFQRRSLPRLPHLRAEHPLPEFCSPWAGWVPPKPHNSGVTAAENHSQRQLRTSAIQPWWNGKSLLGFSCPSIISDWFLRGGSGQTDAFVLHGGRSRTFSPLAQSPGSEIAE